MSEQHQEARHAATPIRLLQARQHGDFPRSQELAGAIQLFCGSLAVYLLIQSLIKQFAGFSSNIWSSQSMSPSSESFIDQITATSGFLAYLLLPLLSVLLLVAVLSHVVQNTTLSMLNQPLIDIRRLNPTSNLRQVFSTTKVLRAVVAIPKFMLVATICSYVLWQQKFQLANLTSLPRSEIGYRICESVFFVFFTGAITLLIVALCDYLLEWYSFQLRHRMTDQQLRDEKRKE